MKITGIAALFLSLTVIGCASHPRSYTSVSSPQEGSKKGLEINIQKATLENEDYRKVIYSGKHSQLVLMSLHPEEEIGMETHKGNDQFFRFEAGQGKAVIDGKEYTISEGTALFVPAGVKHNIINTSNSEKLKLYAIYSPPKHKEGIVRGTKKEAETDAPGFDGKTTE